MCIASTLLLRNQPTQAACDASDWVDTNLAGLNFLFCVCDTIEHFRHIFERERGRACCVWPWLGNSYCTDEGASSLNGVQNCGSSSCCELRLEEQQWRTHELEEAVAPEVSVVSSSLRRLRREVKYASLDWSVWYLVLPVSFSLIWLYELFAISD